MASVDSWARGANPCKSWGMEEPPAGFIAQGTITGVGAQAQFVIQAEASRYIGNGLKACVKNPIGTVSETFLCEFRCPNGDKGLTKCDRKVQVYEQVLMTESEKTKDKGEKKWK